LAVPHVPQALSAPKGDKGRDGGVLGLRMNLVSPENVTDRGLIPVSKLSNPPSPRRLTASFVTDGRNKLDVT